MDAKTIMIHLETCAYDHLLILKHMKMHKQNAMVKEVFYYQWRLKKYRYNCYGTSTCRFFMTHLNFILQYTYYSLLSRITLLQKNVQKNINDKKTTFPMFNTIEHMWIGADYWPTEENWKWRNSYIDFDGNI